ncbi:MAG: hypothetical protein H6556_10230 [Lewinellaceae bacterium]|nr:hypothetical protein [Lewinellaceae bacterium]
MELLNTVEISPYDYADEDYEYPKARNLINQSNVEALEDFYETTRQRQNTART